MFRSLLRVGSLFTLAFPIVGSPVQAQDSSWSVRAFADLGWTFHLRNLGKNPVSITGFEAVQTVAELDHSPMVGGGVEVLVPGRSVRILGKVQTTLGGAARGVLALCETGAVGRPGEGLCAVEVDVDARVTDAIVEAILVRSEGISWFRPLFSLGFGLRNHEFGSDASACGGYTGDELNICVSAREIFENPGINPLLTFGLGAEADRDPLSGFLHLRTLAGHYNGGAGLADGEMGIDLILSGGVRFRVW